MNKIKIKVINTSNNGLPKYETLGSAGMDVRAVINGDMVGGVPDYNMNYSYTLQPGERAMIHTGLYMSIPEGYQMEVRPRSGLAAKHGIMVTNSPGTIDSDYRGECNVLLINNGDKPFIINNGDRIGQFVLMPVLRVVWEEVDTLSETTRGEGGFGHTGKI